MSTDDPKPQKTPLKAPQKVKDTSIEAETTNKIAELEARKEALQQELHIMRGKLLNRNPVSAKKLKRENEDLRARLARLERALFGLILDSAKPRKAEDTLNAANILRQAAVQYFQNIKLDPQIWKNIAS
ncbi:MAG: hypothetical protein AABZ06_08675 [Bdellovibrionota bacterium]